MSLPGEEIQVRRLQEELAGEEVAVVDSLDDDGGGVVDEPVGAAVADRRVGFVEMIQDIPVALAALPLAFRVPAMEFRADVLPGRRGQDDPFVVDDGRGEGVYGVEPILEVLELLDVDQVRELVRYA